MILRKNNIVLITICYFNSYFLSLKKILYEIFISVIFDIMELSFSTKMVFSS